MDPLLGHHIEETRRNFEQVHDRLGSMGDKLDDLGKFKVEMVVSSRWVSLLVSAALGFITLVVSALVSAEISSRAQARMESRGQATRPHP